MPTLDHLFIIIISILIISIILSIIDWIYLTTLSTKTTLLEREVEKRSQEFDALKKERLTDRPPATGVISVIESDEFLDDTGTTTTTTTAFSSEDTIQIVRNIRGSFETSEHASQNAQSTTIPEQHSFDYEETIIPQISQENSLPPVPESLSAKEPIRSEPLPPEPSQSPPTPGFESPVPGLYQEPLPSPPPAPAITMKEPPSPALPVQNPTEIQPDAEHITGLPPLTEKPQVFKLFSDASKDADFKILWHNINHILTHQQTPQITVDFDMIHYIYDKEMEYLEKMYYLIAGQGGSLSFINCDEELTELLNKNTLLRSIVKNKQV